MTGDAGSPGPHRPRGNRPPASLGDGRTDSASPLLRNRRPTRASRTNTSVPLHGSEFEGACRRIIRRARSGSVRRRPPPSRVRSAHESGRRLRPSAHRAPPAAPAAAATPPTGPEPRPGGPAPASAASGEAHPAGATRPSHTVMAAATRASTTVVTGVIGLAAVGCARHQHTGAAVTQG